MGKIEHSIMPLSNLYEIERFNGSERHEPFGARNRKKSIEYGMIVFLTYEQHRGTNGVHGKNGIEYNLELKRIAQKAFMEHYGKTIDDFIKEFGKNYL